MLRSILVAGVALLLLVPAGASAEFGVTAFDGQATVNEAGDPMTQAGGHPFDASTQFVLKTSTTTEGFEAPEEGLKDAHVTLPPGLVGNPTVAPRCSEADLRLPAPACSPDSQVGVAEVVVTAGHGYDVAAPGSGYVQTSRKVLPLFNMIPPPGVAAQFAFNVGNLTVPHLDVHLDPEHGYTVRVDSENIAEVQPVKSVKVTLWGVPAASSHNALRGFTGSTGPDDVFAGADGGQIATLAPRAFLSLPVDCSAGPLTTTLDVRSWVRPDVWKSYSFVSHLPPAFPAAVEDWGAAQGVTDCHRLRFEPGMMARPSTSAADAPTGLDVDLSFPQDDNPDGLAMPPLRTARVTLPEGMTINPGGADGLVACSDEQANARSSRPFSCPDGSKVGTVVATTPLLSETLTGGVYVGSQKSSDPASGEMFRLFLRVVNEARGIDIRLPGQLRVDPATGRIETTFENNPQMPVDTLSLRFKAGPRAPLVTPATCGEKSIDAQLTAWSAQTVSRSSGFGIDCAAGLGGFSPSMTAGTAEPAAGAFSPFALSLSKPDGNTAINGLSMVLPTGLLARLKGNLATQVGTVKAFAGPGTNPFMLPGKVFLEGAYDDAPFSLRVVVPAKAGPFDLGDVVVRQKIYVDPITAQVTVVSDPIPTIVKGVPVRLQRLDVNVDKAGFTLNPTSCAPKAISGTLVSAAGQSAAVSSRFQVGDCGALALKPKLDLTLSGKGQTTDGKHPAVTATLTQPFGAQSNLKKVRVALPLSLALDPDNANGLCEFADGSKTVPTCPKASIVGTATAVTPILDEPLSGPVYFVKNIRKDPKSGREIRTLPKLVIPLVGQNGVKLTLTGTSNVENDQLVTTFDNIPDAPVSSFKLNIIGGKGGILTVSGTDICKATQIADQQIDGQNNKQADTDVYIQTPSCPTKILSKTVTKTTVKLKIGGLGAGKVRISGRGIKTTAKTIIRSTVATITAKRTKGKPGKVTVSFDPAGPAKARNAAKE